MTQTTEQKAQAMVVEVLKERGIPGFCIVNRQTGVVEEALCRSIEQREAAKQELSDFRQEVSDVVRSMLARVGRHTPYSLQNRMHELIIPKPKPDPLVGVMKQLGWYNEKSTADFRAALDARGFEIREKG